MDDISELLKIIREEKKINNRNYIDERCDKFILNEKLSDGIYKSSSTAIYTAYILWENRYNEKSTKQRFFRRFGKMFKARRTGKVRYYLLNKNYE